MKLVKSKLIIDIVVASLILCVSLLFAEGILRYKNSDQRNYNIEMWKYSKVLKELHPEKGYDFKHVKNFEAILQNVKIRTNQYGLRGNPVSQIGKKLRILFLGGSITLGWGVEENQTMISETQRILKNSGYDVEVLNGGVGNYNIRRYTNLFFDEFVELRPNIIILNFFVRDLEDLPKPSGNFLLRNSQLAVTLWLAYQKSFNKFDSDEQKNKYLSIYSRESEEYKELVRSFNQFKAFSIKNGTPIWVAMIPDVKTINNYQLQFAHNLVRETSIEYGFEFIDFFDSLSKYRAEELFILPDDPHPNEIGQRAMAEKLSPILLSFLRNTIQ